MFAWLFRPSYCDLLEEEILPDELTVDDTICFASPPVDESSLQTTDGSNNGPPLLEVGASMDESLIKEDLVAADFQLLRTEVRELKDLLQSLVTNVNAMAENVKAMTATLK